MPTVDGTTHPYAATGTPVFYSGVDGAEAMWEPAAAAVYVPQSIMVIMLLISIGNIALTTMVLNAIKIHGGIF